MRRGGNRNKPASALISIRWGPRGTLLRRSETEGQRWACPADLGFTVRAPHVRRSLMNIALTYGMLGGLTSVSSSAVAMAAAS